MRYLKNFFSFAGSTGKTRKRKPSESEPVTKPRLFKENVENKQTRRKTINNRYSNRKKVLEEANNSKLREIEVRVEDCLQTNSALSLLCRQKLEEHTDRPPDPPDSVPVVKTDPSVAVPPAVVEEISTVVEDTNGINNTSEDSCVELVSENINDVASEDVVQCAAESSISTEEVLNEGGDNIIVDSNSTGGSSEQGDCVIVTERTNTPTNTLGQAADQERDCSIRGEHSTMSRLYKCRSPFFFLFLPTVKLLMLLQSFCK